MRILTAIALIALTALAGGTGWADGPPYTDEDVLGLELSGELLAPPALVAQIGQDLAAIRAAFPEVADIHVFPSWAPGELGVGLTDDGWAAYQAGTFAELDSLNAWYGAVEISELASYHFLAIDFGSLYHPLALGDIYRALEGVSYAEPNWIGGDGSDISVGELPVYTFKHGWGDCPSGCMYNDYWIFSVDGESVTLIDHYGYSVAAVQAGPVGKPAFIRDVAPNPFNPRTVVSFDLAEAGSVVLEVFDVRGHLVRRLVAADLPAGVHRVPWDGRDEQGRQVTSGVYLTRLTAGGVTDAKKVMLVR